MKKDLLTEEEAEILSEFFVPNLWMSESGIIYNVGQQIPHRPYVWMDVANEKGETNAD